jgi:hypothetical protein
MGIADYYTGIIRWIGDGTGATDSLLHVHAGMAVLLIARVLTRRSLATPVPFLAVCVAEAANEIMDRLSYGAWRWDDTMWDVLNTLFWPFVLMVGLRLRRVRSSVVIQPAAAEGDLPADPETPHLTGERSRGL